MQKICVLGLGYIGLPTAALLACSGYKVVGVDINKHIIEEVNRGKSRVKERSINKILNKAIKSGNLTAKSEIEDADVFLICVPTPVDKQNKCELRYVFQATNTIAKVLKKGGLVILESTVPPRTTEKIAKNLEEKTGLKAGKDFFVAHCPERTIPGNLIHELKNNDRVIGGINKKSAEMAKKTYESFVSGKIHLTDSIHAEMAKLVENAFRDMNIAFANELAKICEELGLNVWEVIELANKHPRVSVHEPGPGVGGHCVPIDPWFIVEKTTQASLIPLARKINNSMAEYVVNKIKAIVKPGKKISVFGIAYKGNVDDTRESPGKKIVDLLKENGYKVCIYDPVVFEHGSESLEKSIKGSSCIIVTAGHDEFKSINPKEIGKFLDEKIIFDTKNCIDLEKWKRSGFRTILLGAAE